MVEGRWLKSRHRRVAVYPFSPSLLVNGGEFRCRFHTTPVARNGGLNADSCLHKFPHRDFGGGEGGFEVGFRVTGRNEVRFVLAAGEVDPFLEHRMEEFREASRIGFHRDGQIRDRFRVEEQRDHAAEMRTRMRDTFTLGDLG